MFALHWEARSVVHATVVTVPAATATGLADAGALSGATVVGGMVLLRTKSPDNAGVRARLREWLSVPHDRRWMVATMSSEVMNALERTGVGQSHHYRGCPMSAGIGASS
jgi:hypothetical protein